MKRNRLLSIVFLIALIGGLCLGITLLSWGIWNLPTWTENQYGPAAASLGRLQRIYLSTKLLRQAEELKQPVSPNAAVQDFRVELGESPQAITNRLEQSGLVASADAMLDYLVYAGLDTTIQAGDYQLGAHMTPLEIAHILQDATPSEVVFNILPGWRAEEIAAALPTSGLGFSAEDFLTALTNQQASSPLQAEIPAGASLEGFLFPGSYQVRRDLPTSAFVNLLVDNFRANLSEDLRQGIARQGLSLYEAVILASIVQREAVVEEEMPMLASVFLNRLQAGIKLDADPTVQYALGYNTAQNTWWTNPLSQADLQTNSPYNTYLNWGLPPGPIANPDLKALQAVAFPAQTPYFFFRAACDGSGKHSFAESFEQHVGNACP